MRLTGLWWWIDRWRKSTAYTDMTLEEQGAYRNLLDEASLRGGPLPNDEGVLAKACGDPRRWRRVRATVMRHFELAADQCWHNTTLDEVLARSSDIHKARAEAGRHGGLTTQANRLAKPKANVQANRLANTQPPDPDPEPKEIPPPKNGGGISARATSIGVGLLKPHGNVAFDSPRVYVPWKLHFTFQGLRNNSSADQELQAFYQQIADEWTTGAHAADQPGSDMFTFWRARYDEHWPPSAASVSGTRGRTGAPARDKYIGIGEHD